MTKLTKLEDFASRGISDRRKLNGTLTGARNATMLGLIGNPCGNYGKNCQEPTNAHIAALMVAEDMGPFRVRGLRPAVQSLKAILDEVQAARPELHASLGSAGMLCCRLVRGSATAISNHSWGTAIDLTINGILDPRGDGVAQAGLFDLHPFFNRHGFFWGAAFGTEDAMHFEASDQLIRQWAKNGEFSVPGKGIPSGLTTGDRGPLVEALQSALNHALAPMQIDVDGVFGSDTRAMVVEFQRKKGLAVDGVASTKVQALLGLGAPTGEAP
jgi:hypothetical protein